MDLYAYSLGGFSYRMNFVNWMVYFPEHLPQKLKYDCPIMTFFGWQAIYFSNKYINNKTVNQFYLVTFYNYFLWKFESKVKYLCSVTKKESIIYIVYSVFKVSLCAITVLKFLNINLKKKKHFVLKRIEPRNKKIIEWVANDDKMKWWCKF